MNAANTPWQALEGGKPLESLAWWREQLHADPVLLRPYLQAAEAGLPSDPLAGQRRQALALIANLSAAEPGEREIQQLGGLLRSHAQMIRHWSPQAALLLLERAWCCGHDSSLDQSLADLYAQQGVLRGARALALPQEASAPWPQPSCLGLHCLPCAAMVLQTPDTSSAGAPLPIQELPRGRIWVERHPLLQETLGIGVADHNGTLQPELCRRYPWHWPGCEHHIPRQQQRLQELAAHWPAQALRLDGPVLAVAELSAEVYYHSQLELLPRLGRSWQALNSCWPGLRLWHNGGRSPWLQEALALLQIPSERVIWAHQHPQLIAESLLVPSHPSAFGVPDAASLSWLRAFWGEAVQAMPAAPRRGVLLSRPWQQRRPLLQYAKWCTNGGSHALHPLPQGLSVREQLRAVQAAERLVAVHGGAMANLLLAPAGTEVLELANPAYIPPYFHTLLRSGELQHQQRLGLPTPQVLQDLLYVNPIEWPIDCPPPR